MQFVKLKSAQKYENGFPLIKEEDLTGNFSDNCWSEFFTTQQKFIGVGFISRQNRAAGWILSKKKNFRFKIFFKR